MAAITYTPVLGSIFQKLAEDIDDGETDTYWLTVPPWAKYATVYLVMETLGGTSIQLSLKTVPPGEVDDDHAIQLREAAAFAALTSADVTSVVDIGPGVTGIADDATGGAAADSYASLNVILPPILGVAIISVGANNIYDLSVVFKK